MKSIFQSNHRSRRNKPDPQNEQLGEQQPFFGGKEASQPFIQPKLTVGQPDDAYEQEADAVADQVVSADPQTTPTVQPQRITPLRSGSLQRLATPEEDKMPSTNDERMAEDKRIQEKAEPGSIEEKKDEPIQMMAAPEEKDEPIQMMGAPEGKEEDKELQTKTDGQAGSHAHVNLSTRLSARKGAGAPLPAAAKAQMEQGIGSDFSDVRVHTDSEAADMNKDLHAQAFTHEKDIFFNMGKFNPESKDGQKLLAHELTHVVQQGGSQGEGLQRDPEERISRNTSWGNLDETALGTELAGLLPTDETEVRAVFTALGATDRDDVAYAMMISLSEEALRGCSHPFLSYIKSQLSGGWTSDTEYRMIGRLDQILEASGEGVTQSVTTPSDLSADANTIINNYTSWGNLDEPGLGAALAGIAVINGSKIIEVLEALGSTDRDDVAEAIVNNLSDANLAACSQELLQRLQAELLGRVFSYTADAEYQAVGRLDVAIGHQTLTTPTEYGASPSNISFAEFIQIIESEEARVSPEERVNTRFMISRLRKLFYGTSGWESQLIPGAADVEHPYPVREETTVTRDVQIPYYPDGVTYTDGLQINEGAPGGLRNPSTVQEVRMPDNTLNDIGHVFAGLDALNHPSSVGIANISIENNMDAATWIGDLGSVLAEGILLAINEDRVITYQEYQNLINIYASPQDMLGNIDAYVIGANFDVNSTSGLAVSEILNQYYLGEASQPIRAQRYSTFIQRLGGILSNGSIQNKAELVEMYGDDLNDAAAMYMWIHLHLNGVSGLGELPLSVLGTSVNQEADRLLTTFFNSLEVYTLQENSMAAR